MKAALYARVSTDEQARDGFSLDAQERALMAFCASQGWEVADLYRDEGWSAKSLERPAMQRLLDDSRRGAFDVVLVWRVDRLSRRQRDVLHVIEDVLEPAGVGFRSITESFDTTSPAGKAMLGMLAVFAQLERETIVARSRMGMKQRIERGLWSGIPPYGTRYAEDGRLEADQATLPHLSHVFEWTRDGVGQHEIIRRLAAEGAPPPLGRKRWSRSTHTIHWIVRNRAYLGERRTKDGWIKSGHAPIIDRELFAEANRSLALRLRHHFGPVAQHLLTGILRCPTCGGTLSWNNQRAAYRSRGRKDYHYYVCRKGCTRLRAEWAEERFTQAFLAWDTVPDPGAPEDTDADERKLADVDDRIGRLAEAVEEGALPLEAVRARMSELQRARSRLARAPRATSATFDPDFVRTRWPRMTFKERRLYLTAILDGAEVDKGGNVTFHWA